MARKSNIARDLKRERMHAHYKPKRDELKKRMRDHYDDPAIVEECQVALQRLPTNSSPTRLKNRCIATGRSRAYMRKFGVSRITFRELAALCLLPGVRKSSW